MNAPTKLAAYGAGLIFAFAGAYGVGATVGGGAAEPAPVHGDHPSRRSPEGGDMQTMDHTQMPPAGLEATSEGYTFEPVDATIERGADRPFQFRITGPDGAAVTDYATEHDKDLHLIVVRRDLGHYQHVHPTMAADGTWSVPLDLPAGGAYRAFADFAPAGAEGLTLGADLRVRGPEAVEDLPAPATIDEVDGYEVELVGDVAAGAESELTLRVTRDGAPVIDLEPYLGAYGHLVALRADDLAYLHVHPEGEPGDGRTPAGPEVTFRAHVPAAGAHRLFFDFRHEGTVRTAAFTVDAAPAPPAASTDAGHDAHGDH